MDLPRVFAGVAAVAIALYVVADGFDLGVGILFLVAPREADRDLMMECIAPFWDGNETWLVFGGSLLLAVFPIAYTVLLPAFYLPLVLMLFALVFRGIAFEFRHRARRFRRVWDFAFAGGSLLATLSQGFVLGGFIHGVPVSGGVFAGGTFTFFTILGLLCGVGLVGGYALLGAGWLIWKCGGSTQVFGREVGHAALLLTGSMMAAVSAWTALTETAVAQRWFALPDGLFYALCPLAAAFVLARLWGSLWGKHDRRPFVLALILFLLGYAGLAISLWPYVVPRTATIWSAAADRGTLVFLGIGVAVILPVILAYLAHAYWVFRGKVQAGEGEEVRVSHGGKRVSALETDLHLH